MMRTILEGVQSSSRKFAAFVGALVLAATLSVVATSVVADKAYADEYEYTVTLYAGNGQIDGKDSVVVGTYGYGKQATIDWTEYDIPLPDGTKYAITLPDGTKYGITLPDDRYYVKGVRLAGHDDASVAAPSFVVKENTQYVIAYGLKKGQTNYTVKYVDVNGVELAEPQTFTGNVGDKPVVAYRYIEGYEPQNALNITGTLDKNEAANVFTFEYAPAAATEAGEAGSSADNATAGESADENGDTEGDATVEDDGQQGDAAGPVELADIDDEENPLAGMSREDQNGLSVANVLPWVFGVLVVAALIAVIALVVARNRAAKHDA